VVMNLEDILKKAKSELLKKQPKRLNIWTAIIIMLILIDEWVKEGYILNPSEFTKPLSHEFLLIITLLISFCLNQIFRKKEVVENGNNG